MISTLFLFGALLVSAQSIATQPASVLELRVFDADGKRAPVDANRRHSFKCADRILYCVRCPKGETPREWRDTPEGTSSSFCGPADTSFVVEPGERYVYAYVGKDIQPIEGEVTIGFDDALTVRELHVGPVREREKLRVLLARPNGAPLQHDFQVSVESLVTGLTLFRAASTPGETRYGDLLPVGRYRVRFETEENAPGFCGNGWMPEPAPFGDWVETIDLVAGQPVLIDSFLWLGGKLRLALDVPVGVEALEKSWSHSFPTQSEPKQADWLGLGRKGPGARVTLRPDPALRAAPRERGMPIIADTGLSFFYMPRLHPTYQYDVMLPGDEQTSADWIPPGDYIVRVEARDFAPTEAKVRIQAEVTTELRIGLTPR